MHQPHHRHQEAVLGPHRDAHAKHAYTQVCSEPFDELPTMRALGFQEYLIVPFLAGAEKVTQLFLVPALQVLEGTGCCLLLVGAAAGLLCVPRVVISIPQIRRGHSMICFWGTLFFGGGGVHRRTHWGFPGGASRKEPTCQHGRRKRPGFNQDSSLKEEMATHSSILAGKIPLTEEPGRLQSMGSQRVRQD